MTKLKPLVIKVNENSVPNGDPYKWNNISEQIESFTRDIITPDLNISKDGKANANIAPIVSGMPTIFARANLFKLAIDYPKDSNGTSSGLLDFYSTLVDEWRGLIACIALDYANIEVERIYLTYSDNKRVKDTGNIYEPKGAFGNLLFDKKPLWCEQNQNNNEENEPFIDVITYKKNVIGGTSPESLLFTAVSYKLSGTSSFYSSSTNRFRDPLRYDISDDQVLQLYGYLNNLVPKINTFKEYFSKLNKKIQPSTQNITTNLRNWLKEIEKYAYAKNINLENASAPPIDKFLPPFDILFNHKIQLFGSEGLIYDYKPDYNHFEFDPKDLLLSESAVIAQFSFSSDVKKNIDKQPICCLQAESKDGQNKFYFAIPLSPLGLNVFGKNISSLVGVEDRNINSRLKAVFDPNLDKNNLMVTLNLKTIDGKEKKLDRVYTTHKSKIEGQDILIWPNFISKQWNRYFMYSELPHEMPSSNEPFKATPFVGDMDDENFKILTDENDPHIPALLAKGGKVINSETLKDKLKVSLHISSNNAVADNKYKYEIYESNLPFKGIKLNYSDKESGYIIIRYSINDDNLPMDFLNTTKDLGKARVGIDFGSTNTSISYFSENNHEIKEDIVFKNRRVSLFANDNKNNNEKPAVEDEIFFFQNNEVKSNALKSMLTIHDEKRIVTNSSSIDLTSLIAKEVKGGFPCFENNLPIERTESNRYILSYQRVGNAEIVHNMKWANNDKENNYKNSYLGSLMLHLYAQLFHDGHEPTSLKWSYPSSMNLTLVNKYSGIWESLERVNPLHPKNKLDIFKPNNILNNTNVDNETSTKSLKFDFEPLEDKQCLSEATAVANFLVNNNKIQTGEQYLTISFDIGGSTTDIAALCQMKGPNGNNHIAMVKQNSIRFAAQRVSGATKNSKGFKNVLLEICEEKGIKIQGLNNGPDKYTPDTAPYYFEQIVDRLENKDFGQFYQLVKNKCPELMSVNLYVTGLIIYYAGQLSFKLVKELRKSEEFHSDQKEDWKPIINIVFAGKGARIFDWFKMVDERSASKYYNELFMSGFGGKENTENYLQFFNKAKDQIVNLNPTNQDDSRNVKYEVSKGLAYPCGKLLVPKNNIAIEILGEEGFLLKKPNEPTVALNYDDSITPEMLENINDSFTHFINPNVHPCPKFRDFAEIFYNYATTIFGLKMNQDDFQQAYVNMNINSYIKSLPEYAAATLKRKESTDRPFEFIAPIIILEGMKFYDDFLLKGISK
jgi:hypothetical protein